MKDHVDLVWEHILIQKYNPKVFQRTRHDTYRYWWTQQAAKYKKSLEQFYINIPNWYPREKILVQREQEYDFPLLFDFIRRRIHPSTTVGSSKLKENIKRKGMCGFNNAVIEYNTLFEDTRDKIMKEKEIQWIPQVTLQGLSPLESCKKNVWIIWLHPKTAIWYI